jgi:alkylhydroperoxidase family enzyme
LDQNFSKAEIADLTMVIANINSWNRLNISWRTVPGNYKVGQFN